MPTRSEIKIWRSLRRRKGRDATGCFLAEGRRVVEEVLGWAGPIVALLCAESVRDEAAVRDLLEHAIAAGVRVELVPGHVIETISDAASPQPLLAIAEIPRPDWQDIGMGTLVLLDAVQDPGNLGTLIRTAVALGAAGVACVGEGADPWGPKALRASAGAALKAPVLRADLEATLTELRRREAPIWVASADGVPVRRGDPVPAALVVVLGSEAHGVSEPLRQAATRIVSVPMGANVESLNVAVAGGILLDRIADGV